MIKSTGFEFQKATLHQDFRLYRNSSQIPFIPQKQKRPQTASNMSEAEKIYVKTWVYMSSTFCKRRFSSKLQPSIQIIVLITKLPTLQPFLPQQPKNGNPCWKFGREYLCVHKYNFVSSLSFLCQTSSLKSLHHHSTTSANNRGKYKY